MFRLAALGALAVSLLEVVRTYTGVELAFLDLLPLASLDFGWVLPAAVCGASGRPDSRRPDCRLLMPYFHFSHTGGLIV